MKKILLPIFIFILFSSCSLLRVFQKKEKYGCPSNVNNIGAERVMSGEPKAVAAARKAAKKNKGIQINY